MKAKAIKTLHLLKNRLIAIVMFMVIFSLLPIALEYYYIKSSNTEDWFLYSKTEVTNQTVEASTGIILVTSYAVIKRPVELNWNDTLMCKYGDAYQFVASNKSSRFFTEPTVLPKTIFDANNKEEQVPWQFILPANLKTDSNCYIESTITAKLPYHLERTQTIRSNEFSLK